MSGQGHLQLKQGERRKMLLVENCLGLLYLLIDQIGLDHLQRQTYFDPENCLVLQFQQNYGRNGVLAADLFAG